MHFPIINIDSYIVHIYYTVDGERFAGVNICDFSAIEVFMEILSHSLGHKCSLFSTIKERCLHSWKSFCGTPENRENHKSLAQRIFPIYGIAFIQKVTKLFLDTKVSFLIEYA